MITIEWVGARNYGPRRDGTPRALVLHVMGGGLAACDAWFNDPRCETSAHFGVGRNGDVHQYVRTEDAAYANGIVTDALPPDHGHAAAFLAGLPPLASPNRYSISIEHEGQAGDPLDGALFTASVELAVSLFGPGGALEGVPCDREHVLRHGEIGGHPFCPGFAESEMQAYIAAVNRALAGTPPVAPIPAEDVLDAAGLAMLDASIADEVEIEMPVEMHGLDQSDTAKFVQRFVAQAVDVVADNAGDGAFVVLGGLPDMKSTHDYIVLALKKEAP